MGAVRNRRWALLAAGAIVGESFSPAGFFVDGIDVLALDGDRFVTVGFRTGGSAFWVPCALP